MRVSLACLLWSASLLLPAGPARGQTAEQIVREAIRTQGGQQRLAAIEDLYVHIDYDARQGQDRLEGDLFEYYQPPDRLVTVLRTHAKPDMIKVYDGKQGRFMRAGHPRVFEMDRRDLSQMKESLARARLLILTNLFVEGARFALVGKKRVRLLGTIYEVRWQGPDGQVVRLEIDGKNYLLHRASFGADGRLKVVFSKHATYKGVRLPSRLAVYQDGKKTVQIEVKGVRFNRKLDAAVFVDPRKAMQVVESSGLVRKK